MESDRDASEREAWIITEIVTNKLHVKMIVAQLVNIIMKPEYSLSYSQEPGTGLC
jgi:hypothetical protein